MDTCSRAGSVLEATGETLMSFLSFGTAREEAKIMNNYKTFFKTSAKMDVFLENFQTALPPPPRPFLEITLRFFPENPLSMRKFAMKFFGLAMTPPPSPPFLEITLRFFSRKSVCVNLQ